MKAEIQRREAEMKAEIAKLKSFETDLLTHEHRGKTIAELAAQSEEIKKTFVNICDNLCSSSDTPVQFLNKIFNQTLEQMRFNTDSYVFHNNNGEPIFNSIDQPPLDKPPLTGEAPEFGT
ncbi:MAG: hypothetical protein SFT68_01150 [Rickettsiaceae bacterium]|nr:hypothetical protein [Rickettsiaceae bacterium]